MLLSALTGEVGEPLLIDPRRIHSVVAVSAVRFCLICDLQHIGGTGCGICAARIRENFRKSLVLLVGLLVGRPGLDPGTLGLKETFNRLSHVGLVVQVV